LAGVGDSTHLTLAHEGGAVSQVAVSLTVSPDAAASECTLWGPDGPSAMPQRDVEAPEAFGRMADALLAQLDGGPPVACDVAFARDVVGVLAAAQRSRDDGGVPVAVPPAAVPPATVTA